MFRQNHSTGFTERRLDCIFISNYLKEFAKNKDILPALSNYHSPSLISLKYEKPDKNGNGFWKFNNCLICDAVYDEKAKKLFQKSKIQKNLWKTFKQNGNFKNTKFENSLLITQKPLLKREKKRSNLELKLKNLENNLNCEVNTKYITTRKII